MFACETSLFWILSVVCVEVIRDVGRDRTATFHCSSNAALSVLYWHHRRNVECIRHQFRTQKRKYLRACDVRREIGWTSHVNAVPSPAHKFETMNKLCSFVHIVISPLAFCNDVTCTCYRWRWGLYIMPISAHTFRVCEGLVRPMRLDEL